LLCVHARSEFEGILCRGVLGVISLVLKLVPDIPKWQLNLVLLGMVREFHGGTGAAWVTMGYALSKVLQGMKKEWLDTA
jgi:hypothetical protein